MKQGEVCRNYELDWMACDSGNTIGRIDADYLIMTAKGDLEKLQKLVPAPLVATDDVVIYMGYFKETEKEGVRTWAYPFHEWGIGIKTHLKDDPDSEGLFLVQLYVDDDLVLVHGREVWGYPKKIGQMEIVPLTSEDSDHFDYTVGRRGTHLVSGSIEGLKPIDKEDFPFFGKAYSICYRQTPANTHVGLEKNELVYVHLEFEADDTMKGTGSISIEDGPFDQIPIGPLTDITSYFGRCTFNHYGVADRVIETDDLARPLDLSRAGTVPVSV